jgi:PAS domain S-box-containing protein
VRIAVERAQHDRIERRREGAVGAPPRRGDGVVVELARQDLVGRGTLERPLSGEELVQDHARAVEIGRDRRRIAAGELGRHVPGRARDEAAAIPRAVDPGEPEVDQRERVAADGRLDQDVVALDVGVDDAAGVRGVERAQDLIGHGERARQREVPLGDHRAEQAAGDVLHRDERRARRGRAAVEDLDDAGVLHAARGRGLVAEPALERIPGGERGLEDLDRDGPLQRGVIGAEHDTHPALADALAHDVLAGEDLAGVGHVDGRHERTCSKGHTSAVHGAPALPRRRRAARAPGRGHGAPPARIRRVREPRRGPAGAAGGASHAMPGHGSMLTTETLPFHDLVDAAPDGFLVCDRASTIVLANAEAERMFGYARGELIGQPIHVLIPEARRDRHAHYVAAYTGAPRMRPVGIGLELLGRRKDGTELPVEISLAPIRTERELLITAGIRDVTERRRLERENQRVSGYLVSAVDAVQEAFTLFDERDRVVLVNSLARQMFADAVPGPIVGQTFDEVLGGGRARRFAFGERGARSGQRARAARRRSGRRRRLGRRSVRIRHARNRLGPRQGRRLRHRRGRSRWPRSRRQRSRRARQRRRHRHR